jgi:hypothetical protein
LTEVRVPLCLTADIPRARPRTTGGCDCDLILLCRRSVEATVLDHEQLVELLGGLQLSNLTTKWPPSAAGG